MGIRRRHWHTVFKRSDISVAASGRRSASGLMNFRWEGIGGHDFRLTGARRTASYSSIPQVRREVLAPALEARLATPEERFAATRTAYGGDGCGRDFCGNAFLFRRGGERWSHRHAIMVEEPTR